MAYTAKKSAWKIGGGCMAAGALLFFMAGELSAGGLIAVVSSASGPYAEAYAAFKAALAMPADFYDASGPDFRPPEDARYVVAFGAKAAALEYPPDSRLVYALAPIIARADNWYQVSMATRPARALAAYKGLQPGLKRLAVFWEAYPGEKYIQELTEAGKTAGVEIISVKLKSPDSFPEHLRKLMGKMDAFWLMPDPALINGVSLVVLANFSCANSIPFYAPTHALVLNGATASYAPGFAAAGRAAAGAINSMIGGAALPQVIYTGEATLKVNSELTAKCGWPVKR